MNPGCGSALTVACAGSSRVMVVERAAERRMSAADQLAEALHLHEPPVAGLLAALHEPGLVPESRSPIRARWLLGERGHYRETRAKTHWVWLRCGAIRDRHERVRDPLHQQWADSAPWIFPIGRGHAGSALVRRLGAAGDPVGGRPLQPNSCGCTRWPCRDGTRLNAYKHCRTRAYPAR